MGKYPAFVDFSGTCGDFAALAAASLSDSFAITGLTVWGEGRNSARRMVNGLLPGAELCLGAKAPMGSSKTEVKPPRTAARPPFKKAPVVQEEPVEFLLRKAREAQGQLAVLALGPLTNLAAAVVCRPELVGLIKGVIVAGGALLGGDATPAAERNFACDPEAAAILLASGIPVSVCPLDVAERFQLKKTDFDTLPSSDKTRYLAEHCADAPLHAAAAVLFAEESDLFTTDVCFVGVETRGFVTRGKLVTDCFSDKQLDGNGTLLLSMNEEAARKKLLALLQKLA